MALVVGNVFRPLGLPATATPRETRRVIEELAVLSSLGKGVTLEPEALSQIRQTLDDPVARLRAELYWIHSSADVVDPKIDLADEVEVGAAIARLKAAAGRGVTREQAIALHDLAVVKYANEVENGQADDETPALACWADVWVSDDFWAYVSYRAQEANDVRLNEAYLGELRQELPAAVLAPVAARASSFLDADDVSRAGVAIRAIRLSGMPEKDVEGAARTAVSPLRTRIEAGIEELKGIRQAMSASAGGNPANRDAFKRAKAVLVSQVLTPYERLRSADPITEAALGDKVAGEVRGLGVSAYNVLEDWDTAYLLARAGLSLGRSSDALRELARDQATAAVTYHQAEANKSTTARRYSQVVAHLELAASYADDEDDRQQLLEYARGARVQSRLSANAVSIAKTQISEALDRQLATFQREIETGGVPSGDDQPTQAAGSVRRRSSQPASTSPSRRGRAIAVAAAVAVLALGGLYTMARADGSGLTSTHGTEAEPSSDGSSDASSSETSLGEQRLREAATIVDDAYSTGNPVTLERAADMIVAVHREFRGQRLENDAVGAAKALRTKITRRARSRPCVGADFIDYLTETPLFETWARERLASVLMKCAAQHLRAGRYANAETAYRRVLDAPSNERLAASAGKALAAATAAAEEGRVRAQAAAEEGRVRAQVAQIRREHTSALDPPDATGSTWRSGSEVTIANAARYPLELLLSGPDAQRITVPRCTSCKRYSYGSTPDSCSGVPRQTVSVKAGTYSVILRWLKGARATPAAGKWTLSDGQRYEGCWYIVGAP